MKPARIFALGILGLAAAFLLPAVQNYLLYAMADIPVVLLAAGQFYLPRSKRAIQVWFNPIVIDLDGELISPEAGAPCGRLSGKTLTYSFFKQWHEFEIVTHRFWLLAGIGIFSFGALWPVWQVKDDVFKGISFFYVTGLVWMMALWLAMRWVWERRMLRLEGLSIGGFSVTTNRRPPYRRVRYYFVDPQGEYRGAIFDSMVCDQADDMTIIFYNEANPDQSIPASAMLFHKSVWKDASPRGSISTADRPSAGDAA